ncbi:MAG: DUF1318 domain-containing protein [Spirochaetota bacterium]
MKTPSIYQTLPFVVLVATLHACLSLEVPITFTQTQTAAERQMIGNDKQLEKNGWLISSIKTSSSGLQDWKKESIESLGQGENQEEYLLILRSLAYLAPEIQKYKEIGIVGESLNGNLAKNPLYQTEEQDSSLNSARIEKVLSLTNEYRGKIYRKRLANLSKDKVYPPGALAKLKEELKLSYYQTTSPGEFYEIEKGKWVRKE